MKTLLKFDPLFLVFAFILMMNVVSFAQIKVGGYKSIAETDAGAIAAANFAVKARGKTDNAEITLESIEKAESQLVQGTNFRLCMEISISRADEDVNYKQMVKAIIYRNLKQQFTLSSWVEEECAENE